MGWHGEKGCVSSRGVLLLSRQIHQAVCHVRWSLCDTELVIWEVKSVWTTLSWCFSPTHRHLQMFAATQTYFTHLWGQCENRTSPDCWFVAHTATLRRCQVLPQVNIYNGDSVIFPTAHRSVWMPVKPTYKGRKHNFICKPYLSMCVPRRFPRLKLQGKAEVSYAGRQIILQQHVLTLNVPERQKQTRETPSV